MTQLIDKFSIDVVDMAAALANSGDKEQAEFFNVFFKALRINCETPFRFDTQLSMIDVLLHAPAKTAMKFITYEEAE